MLDWAIYIFAILVFFLTHSIPVRPANKARVVAHLGARGFTLGYSMLSIAALGFVIHASGRAPIVELWPWGTLAKPRDASDDGGFRHHRCARHRAPQPAVFRRGGDNHKFDPQAPGIVGLDAPPSFSCASDLGAGASGT